MYSTSLFVHVWVLLLSSVSETDNVCERTLLNVPECLDILFGHCLFFDTLLRAFQRFNFSPVMLTCLFCAPCLPKHHMTKACTSHCVPCSVLQEMAVICSSPLPSASDNRWNHKERNNPMPWLMPRELENKSLSGRQFSIVCISQTWFSKIIYHLLQLTKVKHYNFCYLSAVFRMFSRALYILLV